MRTMPVVIEFEGVAGCGKTTLCSVLKECLEKKGYRVVHLNEKPLSSYFPGFSRKHLFRYFQLFSLKSLLNSVRLLFGLKLFGEYKKFIQLYEIEAVYRHFIKRGSGKRVLVCDQSIIQTIVAFWGYEKEKVFSTREYRALSKYFSCTIDTDGFFCDLGINENICRIHKRARNHGRLDLVSDDKRLGEMISNNYNNLLHIIDLKKKTNKEYYLSMNKSPEELSMEVIEQLSL